MANYIRKKKQENKFTVLPNSIFAAKMSLQATGLLCYLLHLPGDWKIRKTELFKNFKNGRDATIKAFNELILKGYIEEVEQRTKAGKFSGNDYYVSDEPYFNPVTENQETVKKQPFTEKPFTDKPFTEKPFTENQALINNIDTNNDNTKLSNNTNVLFVDSNDFDFRKIWESFRGKRKEYEKDLDGFVKKSNGLNVDLEKLFLLAAGCDENIYFQSWLNDALPKVSTKVKGLFHKFIDAYYLFYNERNGLPPKIDGAAGNAAKSIIAYLKTVARNRNGDLPEEQLEEEVVKATEYIFINWSLVRPFLRDQYNLTQINSNLNNIMADIKSTPVEQRAKADNQQAYTYFKDYFKNGKA